MSELDIAIKELKEICDDKKIHDYILYNCLDENILNIRYALQKAQEQEKVLKIIFEKRVDTRILRNCLKDETPEHYNFLNNKHQLTQEEFDSVKEMMMIWRKN